MNWILFVIILAILIMLIIDLYVFNEKKECFKDEIEYRECKIYNTYNKDFCNSKFASYGQIQILNAIEDSLDPDEKKMLKTVYKLKKDRNLFMVPCEYRFDNLKEEDKKLGDSYYYKRMDDPDRSKTYNMTASWAYCYYDPTTLKDHPLPNNTRDEAIYVSKRYNRLRFVDLDQKKLESYVCKNKDLFYKKNTEKICCKFLKISCSVASEDPVQLNVDKLEIVEFKDSDFVTIQSENIIKDLFTITYDDRKVVFTPIVSEREYYIFDQGMCGNKTLKDKKRDVFHLEMCGIGNIFLTDEVDGLGMTQTPGIYPYESNKRMTLNVRRNIMMEDLDRADKNLVSNKKIEFTACFNRYVKTLNYIQLLRLQNKLLPNEATDYFRMYSTRLQEIYNIIKSLNTYGIYVKDNTHCNSNVDNKAVLGQLKLKYMECSNILKENRMSSDALDAFIKRADSVIADTRFAFVIPEKDKQELLDLIEKAKTPDVSNKCSLTNSLDIQTAKLKIDNVKAHISNNDIKDSILAEYDKKDLLLDDQIRRYVSFDNCIYVRIDEDTQSESTDNSLNRFAPGLFWKRLDGDGTWGVEHVNDVEYFRKEDSKRIGTVTDLSSIGFAFGEPGVWKMNNVDPGRSDQPYAVEMLGYFRPTDTGKWSFWTYCDDDCFVWIGDDAIRGYELANAIVKKRNTQGMDWAEGSIDMKKGLLYPMRIQFWEFGGNDNMKILFSGPNLANRSNGEGYLYNTGERIDERLLEDYNKSNQ